MKTILLILFPFLIQAQIKLTSDQDHAADYYGRAIGTFVISQSINHFIHKPILSDFIGLSCGIASSFLERGLYGKIISISGSISGEFGNIIYRDIKRKKALRFQRRKYVLD